MTRIANRVRPRWQNDAALVRAKTNREESSWQDLRGRARERRRTWRRTSAPGHLLIGSPVRPSRKTNRHTTSRCTHRRAGARRTRANEPHAQSEHCRGNGLHGRPEAKAEAHQRLGTWSSVEPAADHPAAQAEAAAGTPGESSVAVSARDDHDEHEVTLIFPAPIPIEEWLREKEFQENLQEGVTGTTRT
jgi:hypothetical protein